MTYETLLQNLRVALQAAERAAERADAVAVQDALGTAVDVYLQMAETASPPDAWKALQLLIRTEGAVMHRLDFGGRRAATMDVVRNLKALVPQAHFPAFSSELHALAQAEADRMQAAPGGVSEQHAFVLSVLTMFAALTAGHFDTAAALAHSLDESSVHGFHLTEFVSTFRTASRG